MATARSAKRRLRLNRRGAFTLLESIVAITVLAAVMVVSLQLRAQSLLVARRLAQRDSEQRIVEALLNLVVAGLLPGGQRLDENASSQEGAGGRVVWKGFRQGEPYECVKERVLVRNPLVRSAESDPSKFPAMSIALEKYTVRYGDVTAEQFEPIR